MSIFDLPEVRQTFDALGLEEGDIIDWEYEYTYNTFGPKGKLTVRFRRWSNNPVSMIEMMI